MLKIFRIILLSLVLSQSAYAVEQDSNKSPENNKAAGKLEILKPVIPIAPAIPIPSPIVAIPNSATPATKTLKTLKDSAKPAEKSLPELAVPKEPSKAPEISLPNISQTDKVSPKNDSVAIPNSNSQQVIVPPSTLSTPATESKILTLPGQKNELKTLKSAVAKIDRVKPDEIPFPEVDGSLMFDSGDLNKVEIVYRAYRERLKTSAQANYGQDSKNDLVGEILGRLKNSNQSTQLKKMPGSVFLNSIMYHSDKDKVAWIDGKKYLVGESLGSIKLIDLSQSQAKIEFNTASYKFDPLKAEGMLTSDKQKEVVKLDQAARTITFSIRPNQRLDLSSLKIREGKGKVIPATPDEENNLNQTQEQNGVGITPNSQTGQYTGGIPNSPLQFLNDPAINPAASNPQPEQPQPELFVAPESPMIRTPISSEEGVESITSNLKVLSKEGDEVKSNEQLQRIDNGIGKVEEKNKTLQELKQQMPKSSP